MFRLFASKLFRDLRIIPQLLNYSVDEQCRLVARF